MPYHSLYLFFEVFHKTQNPILLTKQKNSHLVLEIYVGNRVCTVLGFYAKMVYKSSIHNKRYISSSYSRYLCDLFTFPYITDNVILVIMLVWDLSEWFDISKGSQEGCLMGHASNKLIRILIAHLIIMKNKNQLFLTLL